MELGPVDRITADAIGEPGDRAFYLQARAGGELVTVAVEKEQVQLLSASILELLADLELETGQGPGEEAMALEEPFEPRWRAGKLSIGFDQDQNLFQLEIEEFQPELACLSAPVLDSTGRVTGAVAFSVPSTDFATRRWHLERAARAGAARFAHLLAKSPSLISGI